MQVEPDTARHCIVNGVCTIPFLHHPIQCSTHFGRNANTIGNQFKQCALVFTDFKFCIDWLIEVIEPFGCELTFVVMTVSDTVRWRWEQKAGPLDSEMVWKLRSLVFMRIWRIPQPGQHPSLAYQRRKKTQGGSPRWAYPEVISDPPQQNAMLRGTQSGVRAT